MVQRNIFSDCGHIRYVYVHWCMNYRIHQTVCKPPGIVDDDKVLMDQNCGECEDKASARGPHPDAVSKKDLKASRGFKVEKKGSRSRKPPRSHGEASKKDKGKEKAKEGEADSSKKADEGAGDGNEEGSSKKDDKGDDKGKGKGKQPASKDIIIYELGV